jgi:hypothetical protein
VRVERHLGRCAVHLSLMITFRLSAHTVCCSVPQYLIDKGIKLNTYTDFLGGGVSPDYGDAMLLQAIQQFIVAFGAKYDGDRRLAFVTLGLLGFWVRCSQRLMCKSISSW